MSEGLKTIIEWIGLAMDCLGVAVITVGVGIAMGIYLVRGRRLETGYRNLRHNLGRAILLGLEALVGADIIRTVAIDPTMQSVQVLGLIVLVRTFLSFALQVELEGRWPWQRERA